MHDINLRSIIAFREIGKGLAALETLAGYMNIPVPMNKTAYNDSIKMYIMHINHNANLACNRQPSKFANYTWMMNLQKTLLSI